MFWYMPFVLHKNGDKIDGESFNCILIRCLYESVNFIKRELI